MSKGFSLKDLYDLVSINSNISPKTAERVWKNILDIIISELQYNDKIAIDNFGRFDKTYEGGKDEFFTNELGNVEKRYVPPVMSIKFTPSINFLKQLNYDVLDKISKVENTDIFFDYGDVNIEEQSEKGLEEQIKLALNRKHKRREKEKQREESLYIPQREGSIPKSGINIHKGKPIKCITINKIFSSINKASKDLNLRPNNIIKVLDTDKDIFGYKFISLTDSEYEKELEKIELMKERNKNGN